jgi:predicted dehydrogenase
MAEGKVGIGLIGLGLINRAHLYGYREAGERAQVVAVCDARRDIAEERAAELGCASYTEYLELLRDPAVEAVDITLPHHLHYVVARAALEHSKHVLIEKPMAATSAECLELIHLARQKGLIFTVAENTRFVAAYIEAERLVSSGALGQPRLIRTFIYGSEVERLRDTTNWKGRRDGTLGGTIFDAGPHSFYLLKWLFGEIKQVQAVQSRLVPESEVEDHAVVSGQLTSGALFTTEYSFTAEIPWGERCEIYGSEGSLIIDQLCNPPALHYHGAHDYDGAPLAAVPYDPKLWKLASIAAGVRDFVDALIEGRSPGVDSMDGYYTLKVVEAAYASVARSGQPVAVSP